MSRRDYNSEYLKNLTQMSSQRGNTFSEKEFQCKIVGFSGGQLTFILTKLQRKNKEKQKNHNNKYNFFITTLNISKI